jgi:hypothetical protein
MTAFDHSASRFPAGNLHFHPTPTPPILIKTQKRLPFPSVFEGGRAAATTAVTFLPGFQGFRRGQG